MVSKKFSFILLPATVHLLLMSITTIGILAGVSSPQLRNRPINPLRLIKLKSPIRIHHIRIRLLIQQEPIHKTQTDPSPERPETHSACDSQPAKTPYDPPPRAPFTPSSPTSCTRSSSYSPTTRCPCSPRQADPWAQPTQPTCDDRTVTHPHPSPHTHQNWSRTTHSQ